jgi:hypothetical protein
MRRLLAYLFARRCRYCGVVLVREVAYRRDFCTEAHRTEYLNEEQWIYS